MYFITSGIELNPLIPPVVAFIVSFFTSMGGVSGAFLLLPFQMTFLGYTSPSVSATNQLFNIVAIPSGVYRYIKEGRMVWPLTYVVIIGTLPGVLLGAIVRVKYLPDPSAFKFFASFVLLFIGLKLYNSIKKDKLKGEVQSKVGKVVVKEFSLKKISYTFNGELYSCSCMGIMLMSLIVGVVGGIYGIGGGSIVAPFFVSFFGLPVYTVAGAALMGTFVTSIAGVAFYQIIAPYYSGMSVAPDYLLGFLFGIGGMAGMYLGAKAQRYFSAKTIKYILSFVILFTAIKYMVEFFM